MSRPPAPGTSRWLSTPARLGYVLAVPVLGLLNQYLGFVAMIAAIVLVWKDSPWQKAAKVTATIAAMALLGAVLPDPPEDGGRDPVARAQATTPPPAVTWPSPTPTASPERPSPPPPAPADYRGRPLDEAREKAEEAGFGVDEHNASDDGKSIMMRMNWTVCFQKTGWTSSGTKTIDFGVVKTDAPCPETDGAAVPWPRMPDLVWKTWKTARVRLTALKVVPEHHLRADTAYGNDWLPDEGEYEDWRVCATDPAEGADVTVDTWVTVELTDQANGCPEPDSDRGHAVDLPDRDDDGDPDYRDPYPGDPDRTTTMPNGLPDHSDDDSSDDGSHGGGWNCPRTRWC
ncbi:hypothetical protein ABZ397_04270 [Streptomyces sp. NPDC005876]|uniref:PASTA domain-containing protein n=1 Tax=Streptomyces sp. NPDC005876 TaxID=3157076 RepID=UPI0033E8D58A